MAPIIHFWRLSSLPWEPSWRIWHRRRDLAGNKKAHLRSVTDNQVKQCSEEKVERWRFVGLDKVLQLGKVIAWCIDGLGPQAVIRGKTVTDQDIPGVAGLITATADPRKLARNLKFGGICPGLNSGARLSARAARLSAWHLAGPSAGPSVRRT